MALYSQISDGQNAEVQNAVQNAECRSIKELRDPAPLKSRVLTL